MTSYPFYITTLLPKHALQPDLSDALRRGGYSDFQIVCEGVTFEVHKFMLACRSDYFQVAMNVLARSNANGQIDMRHEDPFIVSRLLQYIYTNTYDTFSVPRPVARKPFRDKDSEPPTTPTAGVKHQLSPDTGNGPARAAATGIEHQTSLDADEGLVVTSTKDVRQASLDTKISPAVTSSIVIEHKPSPDPDNRPATTTTTKTIHEISSETDKGSAAISTTETVHQSSSDTGNEIGPATTITTKGGLQTSPDTSIETAATPTTRVKHQTSPATGNGQATTSTTKVEYQLSPDKDSGMPKVAATQRSKRPAEETSDEAAKDQPPSKRRIPPPQVPVLRPSSTMAKVNPWSRYTILVIHAMVYVMAQKYRMPELMSMAFVNYHECVSAGFDDDDFIRSMRIVLQAKIDCKMCYPFMIQVACFRLELSHSFAFQQLLQDFPQIRIHASEFLDRCGR